MLWCDYSVDLLLKVATRVVESRLKHRPPLAVAVCGAVIGGGGHQQQRCQRMLLTKM